MGEQMCRFKYGTSLPRSLTWFCLLLLTTSASNGQRIEPGCRELVDIDVGLAACAKTSMRGAACKAAIALKAPAKAATVTA